MQDLKVAILQSNLHWENVEENLNMFSSQILAIGSEADLIVLPEMFNTGFTMSSEELAEPMNSVSMQWMLEMARAKDTVITGSIIIEERGAYFNRLIWMRPDGTHEHYDKRHLFRMMDENKHYSGGNKRLIVELNGWRICTMICYDLRFPVWSRNRNDYDCLLYIANWPTPRMEAWNTLLRARAHENQAYVIGVNRVGEDANGTSFSGGSAIIDPKGATICDTEHEQEQTKSASLSYSELQDFREKFPIGLDADSFEIQ